MYEGNFSSRNQLIMRLLYGYKVPDDNFEQVFSTLLDNILRRRKQFKETGVATQYSFLYIEAIAFKLLNRFGNPEATASFYALRLRSIETC